MHLYRQLIRPALIVSGTLLLAGCAGSPPTQFIALNVTSSSGPTTDIGQPALALGHVELASALDRPYLVRETGANTRKVSTTARWIAPLDQQVHQTLGRDLANRLGSKQYAGTVSSSDTERILSVSIDRFIADANNVVHLTADWHVGAADAERRRSGHAQLTIKAESHTPGNIAAAMSHALGQLSTRIVAMLQRKPANG
ncbi:membrane integrity-associated transporter subunit PqiC [Salinisphaera sp. USBA-960]|nr:membrane integrity-associated transporter subunit PqiC [Salifodinibacter halophilus]NNC27168.1 membrane integrity-associated transporter subunit PqiC [Salifodinibacter halophilus]